MRNARLLLIAPFLFPVTALADDTEPVRRETIASANLSGEFFKSQGVGIEQVLGRHLSIYLGAVFLNVTLSQQGTGGIRENVFTHGVGVVVQPHVYPSGRGAGRGFYVAPFVSTVYYASEGEDTIPPAAGPRHGVGATVGWAFHPGRFQIKLGIGGAFYTAPEGPFGDAPKELKGGAPHLDLVGGFAF